jgi:nickel/cobalt transporter (NicO) family protein
MNERRSIRGRRLGPIPLLGLIALLLGLLAPPEAALAHPADVYLQATYITAAPTQIVVELDLSPGVLVAPQVLPQLDTDGDQQISDAEGQAYMGAVLRNVVLHVDGKPLALAVTKIDMPAYLNIQAGYGTIRIFTTATLAAGMIGTHQIAYTNNFAPIGSAYQVNTFVDKGVAIVLGKQNRDGTQQSITVDYTIGSAAPAATAATSMTAATAGTASLDTAIGASAGASGQARQLLAYLYAPALSPWVLLLALALAAALGGLHALTPGHGKTLVAAYLVGNRGTVRHAIALGAIVTFTHTASVIVIGLLALFASQFVVPDVLVPILEILSGLLVVFMGIRLVWQRWSAFRSRRSPGHEHAHTHDHSHTPDHNHSHDHDAGRTQAFTHDHGDGHTHSHLPPAEGIKLGSLLADDSTRRDTRDCRGRERLPGDAERCRER